MDRKGYVSGTKSSETSEYLVIGGNRSGVGRVSHVWFTMEKVLQK